MFVLNPTASSYSLLETRVLGASRNRVEEQEGLRSKARTGSKSCVRPPWPLIT